jgi:bacteriocin-like protein
MKFIKNCEKLSKEELKSINGGSVPYCPVGKVCYRGEDSNGNLLWDCIPVTSICPVI